MGPWAWAGVLVGLWDIKVFEKGFVMGRMGVKQWLMTIQLAAIPIFVAACVTHACNTRGWPAQTSPLRASALPRP